MMDFCEYCNETAVYIKDDKFLDVMRDCQLLRNEFAALS
jgi:hypothetical protein